jgi:hypothetical protein
MIDKGRVDSFLKSVGQDFRNIKFEEDGEYMKMKIGNFFIKRKISDDYDYDAKKLFEDFITNTTAYYINIFWEQ